jgi:hypothetical protein
MLGCDIYDVVNGPVDGHIGHVQRLREQVAINWLREQSSKGCGIDIRRRENYFTAIYGGPLIVVLVCCYVYLRASWERSSKKSRHDYYGSQDSTRATANPILNGIGCIRVNGVNSRRRDVHEVP